MTEEQILEDIKSIETFKFDEEQECSLFEHFARTKSQYPAEILLMQTCGSNIKKYYYNYSEKLLRYIKFAKIKDISSIENSCIFSAINDEDESQIDFTPKQFSDKIVVYDDYNRLITYDKTTGHYEQFYIDITEEEAKEIVESFQKFYDIKKPMIDSSVVHIDKAESKESSEITNEQFCEAAKIIVQYLKETIELSEVRFQKYGESVKLDLVESLFYNDEDEDNSNLDELLP